MVAQPTGDVTVRMTSADTSAVVVTGALVFTTENWNEAQEVTLSGLPDEDGVNEEVTITHSANGGGYNDPNGGTVTVTANDDDTPALIFLRHHRGGIRGVHGHLHREAVHPIQRRCEYHGDEP